VGFFEDMNEIFLTFAGSFLLWVLMILYLNSVKKNIIRCSEISSNSIPLRAWVSLCSLGVPLPRIRQPPGSRSLNPRNRYKQRMRRCEMNEIEKGEYGIKLRNFAITSGRT
jgi:hypothetical protein